MNENDRKAFAHLSGEENPQFLEDGKRIYLQMKKKYSKEQVEDLDNILNGICASLICLICDSVEQDNRRAFIQLIYLILMKNIDFQEEKNG